MKLGERVRAASEGGLDLLDLPDLTEEPAFDPAASVAMTAALMESESFGDLRQKVQEALLLTLGNRFGEPDVDDDELKRMAVAEMAKVLAAEDIPLSMEERERLVDVIAADLLGYGPLQPLLSDDSVWEVVREQVAGAVPETLGACVVGVAEVHRDLSGASSADIGDCLVDAHDRRRLQIGRAHV